VRRAAFSLRALFMQWRALLVRSLEGRAARGPQQRVGVPPVCRRAAPCAQHSSAEQFSSFFRVLDAPSERLAGGGRAARSHTQPRRGAALSTRPRRTLVGVAGGRR